MPECIVARVNGLYYVLEYEPRDCVWYAVEEGFADSDEAEAECSRRNGEDEDE